MKRMTARDVRGLLEAILTRSVIGASVTSIEDSASGYESTRMRYRVAIAARTECAVGREGLLKFASILA